MNKVKEVIAGILFLYIVLCVATSDLLMLNIYISYFGTIIIFGYLIYFYLSYNKIQENKLENKYIIQIKALQEENQFISSLMNDEQKKQIYLKKQEILNQQLENFHKDSLNK